MNLERAIDLFMLYLATEKGLSAAYQSSVRQSLEWLGRYLDEVKLSRLEDLGTEELAA